MMERTPGTVIRRLFDSRHGLDDRLVPRWIFLRTLAAIYFSAFYSLLFQIKGLVGPDGILPAQQYLAAVNNSLSGVARYWFAPSLFWISSSSNALMLVTWIGLAASVAAFLNLWPRFSFLVCFVCFLSFVAAAGDFSNYQSDGMLLEAGFLALFFAHSGLMPAWGANSPPSRASLYLLQWEWFRIYFESGMVKLLSGDTEWRNLTAMDEYYQNGPLPTWIGWYVQHFPHWFHVASAAGTLVMELGVVLMLFFPRRVRLICFFIVTPWEIGVILTANYTFLNYLVLSLGFLLLDDRALIRFVPKRFRPPTPSGPAEAGRSAEAPLSILAANQANPESDGTPAVSRETVRPAVPRTLRQRLEGHFGAIGLATATVMLTWIAYNTTAEMISMVLRGIPLPNAPIAALEPFRIANQYGLFAVMTRGRYEIEFQGSYDGSNWIAYPFKYKPQALNEAPGIYAPYQPRFDWNLWFASLGSENQNTWVVTTEIRLAQGEPSVLALFRDDTFHGTPPNHVRAIVYQYWMTDLRPQRATGRWWRRDEIAPFC